MITRYRQNVHDGEMLADQAGPWVRYEDIERAGKVDEAMVWRIRDLICDDVLPTYGIRNGRLNVELPAIIRAALEAASLPVGAEAATKLAMPTDPEWYTRKAALEEGHEVGAGSGTANPTPEQIAEYERLALDALPEWARKEILAARAAPAAGVKALEWITEPYGYSANGIGIIYIVESAEWHGGSSWSWSTYEGPTYDVDSEENAKAAAQADYEARIWRSFGMRKGGDVGQK